MSQNPLQLLIDPSRPFLFTLRGTLASPTLEAARTAHNETAGHPQGVYAARALGDLSHNVYSPIEGGGAKPGELLILDVWNSLSGFEKFFADPNVVAGGGRNFTAKDPSIWDPMDGVPAVHLAGPGAQTERYVGMVRAPVKSREAAQKAVAAHIMAGVNKARYGGLVSREFFFRITPPGTPGPVEILGLDSWYSLEGMQASYADRGEMKHLGEIFAGTPVGTTWQKPAGSWVEW